MQDDLFFIWVAMLVAKPGPTLCQDFSRWLPDAGRPAQRAFVQRLDNLHAGIIKRNASRVEPFLTLDPWVLESSISV